MLFADKSRAAGLVPMFGWPAESALALSAKLTRGK
jgi:hypothetical protein